MPTDPHHSWDVLVLIYGGTDFGYTDWIGTHHLVGEIPPEQVAAAAASATRFVNTDIPALTSGNMIPTPTVRYSGTLRASNLAASRMSDSHDLDSSLTKTVHR